MKAILLAVKPNQLVKILNGEKTIEVRKSKLPLNVPVYLYCTKGKPYLVNFGDYEYPYKAGGYGLDFDIKNIKGHGATLLNGKVVAKCIFSEVDNYELTYKLNGDWAYLIPEEDLKKTCLLYEEIEAYGDPKPLYFHHITNLEIFDKPKELYKFKKWRTKQIYSGMDCPPYVDEVLQPLTKAPQSCCYVEVEE